MSRQQRGLSISGFLMGAVFLVFAAVLTMKLIPAYIQDGEIKQAFTAVAHDPEMRDASIRDIQMAYAKRAMVSDITAIQMDDVQISKDDGGLTLNASYQVKIPLVANISLLLEFSPSSR